VPLLPHPRPRTSTHHLHPRAASIALALAFPFIATLIAFLALGGVPRWNDDWFFAQIDHASGLQTGWILTTREPYLPPTGTLQAWRPLHHAWLPAAITTLWHIPAAITVLGVLIHAFGTTMLFKWLRAMGRSTHAAAAAALVYLLWPSSYEPTLWASAYSTLLSCGVSFAAALLITRYHPTTLAARTLHALAFAALIAVVITLNEQPSMIVAAAPLCTLLALHATNPERSPRAFLSRALISRALPHAALLSTLGALVILAYLANVRSNGQRGLGTDPDSYVHLHQLPHRILQVLGGMGDWFLLQPLASGALTLSTRLISTHPLPAALLALALLAATGLSLIAWIRTPTHTPHHTPRNPSAHPAPTPAPPPAWSTALLGITLITFGTLPQAIIANYMANSRTSQFILAGVCILLAAATDPIGRFVHTRLGGPHSRAARRYRIATGLILAAVLWLAILIYVGVQSRFHIVDRWNRDQLATLVSRVPTPAPDTAFVPLAIESLPMSTGHRAFDAALMSCWEPTWMLPYAIRAAYQRPDVAQLYAKINWHHMRFRDGRWQGLERRDDAWHDLPHAATLRTIGVITPDFMQFEWTAAAKFEQREGFGALLTWDRTIPVVVRADGPAPVHTLIVRRPSTPDLVIRIPQAPPPPVGIEYVLNQP
jgi:hypothetical protein